jgi:hypothetical protein
MKTIGGMGSDAGSRNGNPAVTLKIRSVPVEKHQRGLEIQNENHASGT